MTDDKKNKLHSSLEAFESEGHALQEELKQLEIRSNELFNRRIEFIDKNRANIRKYIVPKLNKCYAIKEEFKHIIIEKFIQEHSYWRYNDEYDKRVKQRIELFDSLRFEFCNRLSQKHPDIWKKIESEFRKLCKRNINIKGTAIEFVAHEEQIDYLKRIICNHLDDSSNSTELDYLGNPTQIPISEKIKKINETKDHHWYNGMSINDFMHSIFIEILHGVKIKKNALQKKPHYYLTDKSYSEWRPPISTLSPTVTGYFVNRGHRKLDIFMEEVTLPYYFLEENVSKEEFVDDYGKPATACKVYVMYNNRDSLFKIGHTKKDSVKYRESTLQSSDPQVECVFYYPAQTKDESRLHKIFKDKRIKRKNGSVTEWFDLSMKDLREVISYLEKNKTGQGVFVDAGYEKFRS